MKKPGRGMNDIFSATVKTKAAAAKAPVGGEPIKTTFFLTPHQLDYMDGQTRAIRRASGETLKRSAMLRALSQALADLNFDLSACKTEADIVSLLKKRIRSTKGES